MALIQDIIVKEPTKKTKASPVKQIVAKIHLPHKKPKQEPMREDLVDIIKRFKNRH